MILYVIKSGIHNFRYVGVTNDLKRRLDRHNCAKTGSTIGYGPFRLVHTEEFPDYQTARKREKFLKSGAGRKYLDNLE